MIKEYAGTILDEINLALKDMDYDVLWKMVAEIHGANRIFFHSVGRPAINMKNFAMYLKHFGYRHHIIGETETSIRMAQKCKEIGDIKILLATAAKQSTLGDLADLTVRFDCPLPGVESSVKSVQPIGSLFDQCVIYGLDWALRACIQQRLGRKNGAGPMHSNLE